MNRSSKTKSKEALLGSETRPPASRALTQALNLHMARTSSQQNLAAIKSMKSRLGADNVYLGDMKFLKSRHEVAMQRQAELQSKLQIYNGDNIVSTSIKEEARTAEIAVKVYSSVLSVLYCTVGLESLEKLELQITSNGVSLPHHIFDLNEWLGVLDVARVCRNKILTEYRSHITTASSSNAIKVDGESSDIDAGIDIYPQLIKNLNSMMESLNDRNLELGEELVKEKAKLRESERKATSDNGSSAALSSMTEKLQRLELELVSKKAAEERLAAMLEEEKRARALAELSERKATSDNGSSAALSSMTEKLQRLEADLSSAILTARSRVAEVIEEELKSSCDKPVSASAVCDVSLARVSKLVSDLKKEFAKAKLEVSDFLTQESSSTLASETSETRTSVSLYALQPPKMSPSEVSPASSHVESFQVKLPDLASTDDTLALKQKLIELQNKIGELHKQVRALTAENQAKESEISNLNIKISTLRKVTTENVARAKTDRPLPLSQVDVKSTTKKLSLTQIVKIQAWARKFLARRRARRLMTYRKIAKLGRLLALPKTRQGSTGWYEDGHGNCYYFTYAQRSWTILVGPVTRDQFGSLSDKCAKAKFFNEKPTTPNDLVLRLPFKHSFEHDIIGDNAVIYVDPNTMQLIYSVNLDDMLEMSRMYFRNVNNV